jgi:hypothetical protein
MIHFLFDLYSFSFKNNLFSFRALILFCLFSMGAVANATRDERLFDNPLTRSASHAERSSMYYMFVEFLSCVPFSISGSIHYRLFFWIFVCLFLLAGHKAASLEKMKCNLNGSFDHIPLTHQSRSHVSAPQDVALNSQKESQ